MAQTLRKYKYSSLPDNDTSIRLLTLCRGSFPAEICILLHTTKIEDKATHQFEALSYVWGSADLAENVVVKTWGEEDSHLSVTRNLAEALRYLRHEDCNRVLWIDQICINQEDLVERSTQVKYMAAIYSGARQVLVWLGPEADDSSLALQTLEMLSSKIEVEFETQTVKCARDHPSEEHWADPQIALPFSKQQWVSICALMFRSWFERLWIWQEVRLAQKAILSCGYHQISWEALKKSLACLSAKTYPLYLQDRGYYSRRAHIDDLCDSRTIDFIHAVQDTRVAKCTDPRDRIYALLSISLDGNSQFQPDYTKTVPETYRDFFAEEVRRTERLILLRDCEAYKREYELPSWVPDWSKPRRSFLLSAGLAASHTKADVVSLGQKMMTVTGVFLSSVKQISISNIQADSDDHDISLNLRRLVQGLTPPGFWRTNPKQSELLCSALCAGDFADCYHPVMKGRPRLGESVEALPDLLGVGKNHVGTSPQKPSVSALINCMRLCLPGRALIEIEAPVGDPNLLLGLGPSCAAQGDIIAVLLGCSAPIVLRPSIDETYQVVGEAYVHGVMNGELLLGALDKGVELIWKRDKDGLLSPTFLDRRTATITAEDPRLSSTALPPGWSKELDEFGLPWFWHDDSDEGTECDPRIGKEALLSRGVNLRTFTLV
ncbi:HET-domain-containing protein [Lophium mytilinum]|uniref:HET-domain-containing protein n=1 Tax=Lophium mytilinum TaxID=390894 RepID=A0A6A6QBG2_9PEZI|nr:HET-domain-containing protein [Lophium mytilinum]